MMPVRPLRPRIAIGLTAALLALLSLALSVHLHLPSAQNPTDAPGAAAPCAACLARHQPVAPPEPIEPGEIVLAVAAWVQREPAPIPGIFAPHRTSPRAPPSSAPDRT
jgi:hypothetical protein